MDGYSVNEAATVLGIPEGRVWELLARGVLAGSSEVGGDMRVFLRGTTAPEPASPHATNGGHAQNGGTNGGELSPFRELLTEFRNLTERYGQALLALGEARGEVASLRGRVELLEARVDRRVSGASLGPWGDAPAVDVVSEPVVEVVEPAPPAEEPSAPTATVTPTASTSGAGTTSRKKKNRTRASGSGGSRTAVAGFAQALARADDPTAQRVTEDVALPGAREAIDALAAYRQDTQPSLPAEPEAVEVMAEAETRPSAAVLPPGYSTATPEPDWIAEEDLAPPMAMAIAAAPPPAEPAEPEPIILPVTADEWVEPEVSLGAEPPAEDDASLLSAEVDPFFAEPPIVPREPAFWEPEGRSRAPFAPPELDSWEPAEIAALRIQLSPEPPPAPLPATVPPEVVASEAVATEAASPEAAPLPAAQPIVPTPSTPRPTPPAAASAPVRSAAPRQRSPTARALRRLRRLFS